MNVHFQCVIQVCRYNCPEPKCGGGPPALGGLGGEYGPPALSLGGDYGPPANIHSEYGVPPSAEYGAPGLGIASYNPDPRHPAGPSGAYSEPKPDVVPAPQAQSASNNNNNNGSPVVGPSENVPQNTPQQQPQQNNQQSSSSGSEINLPPPPPPGIRAPYTTVRRKGIEDLESNGNLASLGGRPRSVEVLPAELQGVRKRREADTIVVVRPRVYKREAQEMTDVNTERIIQVVAPGDVNFNLNGAAASNETVVIQSAPSSGGDQEHICLSVASFVAGLAMLLMVLAVACLVAAFLFVRVRAVDRKNATTTYYDGTAEFVKVAN